MIHRHLLDSSVRFLFHNKAMVFIGPRQAGKTTLVHALVESTGKRHVWLNADNTDVRDAFTSPTATSLKALAGDAEILVIDEAQRIENIGICIKLLVDTWPQLQVIATGSSSFELANTINEPLTGRAWQYHLLPMSFAEMASHHGLLDEKRLLHHRLRYGWYPEVVISPGREELLLRQLADSYLYKDILTWERILKPDRLERLVKALALQIGSEVSYRELGQIALLDSQTVERYIDLLEKAYIVFRLHAFSRNVRNELKKGRKVYFYDLGIRNAVIGNFAAPGQRSDTGALWENYLISERLKHSKFHLRYSSRYFWRTTQQQEIDYIEERDGILRAFEFKWNPAKRARIPLTFRKAYPDCETMVVTPENYADFLAGSAPETEQ